MAIIGFAIYQNYNQPIPDKKSSVYTSSGVVNGYKYQWVVKKSSFIKTNSYENPSTEWQQNIENFFFVMARGEFNNSLIDIEKVVKLQGVVFDSNESEVLVILYDTPSDQYYEILQNRTAVTP